MSKFIYYRSLSSKSGSKTTPDSASPDLGLSLFTVLIGCRNVSKRENLDVSRTSDGLSKTRKL